MIAYTIPVTSTFTMMDTSPVHGRVIVGSIKNPPNGTLESAPRIIVTAPPQAPPIADAIMALKKSPITIGITPSTMFKTPIGTADFKFSICSLS